MNMKSIMRRELNIECLRCVAMLFIVLNHCILNIATKQLTLDISPINFCITNFIYQVVYNGVNIFVLISGYFLVDTTRQSTNWEKIMKLWLNVFFYSVVIYILCVVFHYRTFERIITCFNAYKIRFLLVYYSIYWTLYFITFFS